MIVHAALPAWAHGEQLVYLFAAVVYTAPAAVLLFVPWHQWWVRLLVTLLLVAGAVLVWTVVMPRLDAERLSVTAEWVILLSPTVCAVAVAAMIRLVAKARAA